MVSNYPQFHTKKRWGDLSAREMQRMTKGAAIAESFDVQGPYLLNTETNVTRNLSVDIDSLSNYLTARLRAATVAVSPSSKSVTGRSGLWGVFTGVETLSSAATSVSHVAEIDFATLSPKPGKWEDFPGKTPGSFGGDAVRFWSVDTFFTILREHRGDTLATERAFLTSDQFVPGTIGIRGIMDISPTSASETGGLLVVAGKIGNAAGMAVHLFDLSETRELTAENHTQIDAIDFGKGDPVTISGVCSDETHLYVTYDNAPRTTGNFSQYVIDTARRSGLIFKVLLSTMQASGAVRTFGRETPRGGAVVGDKFYHGVVKVDGSNWIQERDKGTLELLRETEQPFLSVRGVG